MTRNADFILLGNKPPMNYVITIIKLLLEQPPEITLKREGQAIIAAIDVTEITRNRLIKDLKVTKLHLEPLRCRHAKEETSQEMFP